MRLSTAIIKAMELHKDQADKNGEPYLWHLLRVADDVRNELKPLAILHDSMEDCGVSWNDLLKIGLTPVEADVIVTLTRKKDESYPDYIQRVSCNISATDIKRADLRDNLNPKRFNSLDPDDRRRLYDRYKLALMFLEARSC